jgi:biopolymer transport protein ExbD
MPLKLEAIEEPALNLTPMLDVVLLLVIFFMVGTQFSEEESHFDIDLPSGRTVEAVTGGPDPIVIDVDREGTVHVGRRTLSLVDLERELNAARERFARQVVDVRGDRQGHYQHVITVLDICRNAGITNVRLAHRVDAGATP